MSFCSCAVSRVAGNAVSPFCVFGAYTSWWRELQWINIHFISRWSPFGMLFMMSTSRNASIACSSFWVLGVSPKLRAIFEASKRCSRISVVFSRFHLENRREVTAGEAFSVAFLNFSVRWVRHICVEDSSCFISLKISFTACKCLLLTVELLELFCRAETISPKGTCGLQSLWKFSLRRSRH